MHKLSKMEALVGKNQNPKEWLETLVEEKIQRLEKARQRKPQESTFKSTSKDSRSVGAEKGENAKTRSEVPSKAQVKIKDSLDNTFDTQSELLASHPTPTLQSALSSNKLLGAQALRKTFQSRILAGNTGPKNGGRAISPGIENRKRAKPSRPTDSRPTNSAVRIPAPGERRHPTQLAVSANVNKPTKLAQPIKSCRPYLSVHLRRQLWEKAEGQCEFVDPVSGRRCGERRDLEIEHRQPVAHGGTNDLINLEMLCRSHNRLRAVQVFGREKMGRFMPGLR